MISSNTFNDVRSTSLKKALIPPRSPRRGMQSVPADAHVVLRDGFDFVFRRARRKILRSKYIIRRKNENEQDC